MQTSQWNDRIERPSNAMGNSDSLLLLQLEPQVGPPLVQGISEAPHSPAVLDPSGLHRPAGKAPDVTNMMILLMSEGLWHPKAWSHYKSSGNVCPTVPMICGQQPAQGNGNHCEHTSCLVMARFVKLFLRCTLSHFSQEVICRHVDAGDELQPVSRMCHHIVRFASAAKTAFFEH